MLSQISDVKTEQKSFSNSQKASITFYGSKLFLKCFGWFIFITSVNILLAVTFVYFYHYKPTKKEFETIASRILENNGLLMAETYEKKASLDNAKYRGPGNFWLFDENINILFNGIERFRLDKLKNDRFDRPNNFLTSHLPRNNFSPKDENNSNSPYKPKSHVLPSEYIKPPQDIPFLLKYSSFCQKNKNCICDFAKSLLNKVGTSVLVIDDQSFYGCPLVSDSGKKYVAVIHIPREIPNKNNAILFSKAKYMFLFLLFVCAVLCFLMARGLAKPIVELQEASRKFAKGDFSQKITKNAMARYDEIGDLAKDFNNMAERIESGISNQQRLFHDISHELRSPLARMQVGIELLQMKVSDSEKSLVERLEKDVTRMNALIEELLQFSKLENRPVGIANEEISLAKALKNVCEDAEFEGNTNHKGVRLEIKEDCIIKGNQALIERAFENIIRNGLRFTPENTVVEVSLEKYDNKAIINISDHGPGVPENKIEKIFNPFYCIKEDRNPQNGGIGLGLCIALKAIQIHNGTIKISNRTEGGLKVIIELPI